MEGLKGKNILLVGATGGIGSKTAKLLSGSGANLFLTGRNEEKLREVADQCSIPEERTFVLDISNPEAVEQLKTRYFEQMPSIDILVNAAGVGIIKTMDTLDEADFMRSIQFNLYAPFLLVKAFLPAMKTLKKGLIINIPGVLGKVPMAGAAAYSASKYGLVGMMQSIREELKRTDIRITNLFLGGVDSPFWDTIDLRVQRDKMIQAEEAAKAIWFLCQQPSSAVVSEMVLQPFNHQAI
jgi:short-subunit dehydrogenase